MISSDSILSGAEEGKNSLASVLNLYSPPLIAKKVVGVRHGAERNEHIQKANMIQRFIA